MADINCRKVKNCSKAKKIEANKKDASRCKKTTGVLIVIQLPELEGQKLIENIGHGGKLVQEELDCHTFHKSRYRSGSGMG